MSLLPSAFLAIMLSWPVLDAASLSDECLRGAFTGITETDPIGNRIGRTDARDWGCLGGGPTGTTGTAVTGVPIPPPTRLCLSPARPNPATAGTVIEIALPASGHLTLRVVARDVGHGAPVFREVRRLIDADLVTGAHTVTWDLRDSDGVRVPAGIYRAVLQSGDQSLCGDVEVR